MKSSLFSLPTFAKLAIVGWVAYCIPFATAAVKEAHTPSAAPTPTHTNVLSATITPPASHSSSIQPLTDQSSVQPDTQPSPISNSTSQATSNHNVPSDAKAQSTTSHGQNQPAGKNLVISVPANATALCQDGAFSFNTHHDATCSHHHGVTKWLHTN